MDASLERKNVEERTGPSSGVGEVEGACDGKSLSKAEASRENEEDFAACFVD